MNLLNCIFLYLFILLSASSINAQKLFEKITSQKTGITFTNAINESEKLNVLSYEYFYNGAGVAVGDINNDGLEDLFFTANMAPNKLYLNTGNFTFKDISTSAGIYSNAKKNTWKTGTAMADVNGDGFLDIYVCYSGNGPEENRANELYINQGNNTFIEQAKKYGIDDKSYTTQAAFFDYDNDGDLDLFLLNHSTKKIDNMELAAHRKLVDTLAGNKLYRNDKGFFTNVTTQAGIYQNPLNFGLGVCIADINMDGWPDIYATNDYNEPDYLYINNKNGTFIESANTYFMHLAQFSMGVDIADFNNDGYPDVLNLDMLPEDNKRQKLLQLQENYESYQLMINQGLQKQYMRNVLQLNNADGTFSEIGALAGIAKTDWSWTPMFADFDNDGYKDVFITNGYLRDYTNKDFLKYWGDYKVKKAIDREPTLLMDLVKNMPSTKIHNYIFRNNGNLTFTNTISEWGLQDADISSGAAYVDLDNDGDLDLVINRINDEPAIYKNHSIERDSTNFITLQLKYKEKNPFGIGTKVYLYSGLGMQYQENIAYRGYLSSVSNKLHFGIDKCTVIDSVVVIWPNEKKQKLLNIKSNRLQTIDYHEDKVTNPKTSESITSVPQPLFIKEPSFTNHINQPYEENDFKRQPLMLYMYSKTGPVIENADVNGDGLPDIFMSGDSQQPAKLFFMQSDGNYVPSQQTFGDEDISSISAVAFFDADNDGDVDLYIAKGGYSLFEANTISLQDEFFSNDGKGFFSLQKNALPITNESSKSCVRPCDYNNDGKTDLFIGGKIIPGQFPLSPSSYLLTNLGNNRFEKTVIPFEKAGMVTDAQWIDIDDDGRKDIVICGEYMPIKLYQNSGKGFIDVTQKYFKEENVGLWQTLVVTDVNKDGKPDIIAGNIGRNTIFQFSAQQPLELYYKDFDGNGSIDPFINFYVQGKSYPFVSRDELNDQIYSMRKKFTSYELYSNATMSEIFPKEELATAQKLFANESNTACYIYGETGFKKVLLPIQAQFSIITKIIADDVDKDGNIDVLLFGNKTDNRLKVGAVEANFGCLLQGDGKGGFAYVPQTKSGLSIKGDVKSAIIAEAGNSKKIIVGVAGQPIYTYKMKN